MENIPINYGLKIEEAKRNIEKSFMEACPKGIRTLFSGGARPKILIEIDGEEWIVKFPSSEDAKYRRTRI